LNGSRRERTSTSWTSPPAVGASWRRICEGGQRNDSIIFASRAQNGAVTDPRLPGRLQPTADAVGGDWGLRPANEFNHSRGPARRELGTEQGQKTAFPSSCKCQLLGFSVG
jgi:hypothetical protein